MKSYILEKTSSQVSAFSKGPKVQRDIVITQNSGFQSVLIIRKQLNSKSDIITTADIFIVDNPDDLVGMLDCPYSTKYPLVPKSGSFSDNSTPKYFSSANDAIRASIVKLDTSDYRGRQHRVVIFHNEDGDFTCWSNEVGVN